MPPVSTSDDGHTPSSAALSRRGFLALSGATAATVGAGSLLGNTTAVATIRPVSPSAAMTSKDIVLELKQGTNLAASPADDAVVLDLQGILWRIPSGGGDAEPLTEPELDPSRPDWSPRSKLLAFQAFKTGNFHIWAMRLDGSGLRQLTDGPFDDREAAWSPDGTKVAFGSDRAEQGTYDLWTVDLADGALTRRSEGAGNDFAPSWHGEDLVFVRDSRALMRVSAGGEVSTVRTVEAGRRIERPSVSPSGRIAYLTFPDATLWVDDQKITDGEDVFFAPPRWLDQDTLMYTADGKVWVRTLSSGSRTEVPFLARFAITDETYERVRPVVAEPRPRRVQGVVTPRVHPDGQSIAFVALNRIWLLGNNPRPRVLVETDDSYVLQSLSWARDGCSLLYSSDHEGLAAIYQYDLASRRSTSLTDLPGGQYHPALSPDGGRLAFEDELCRIQVRDLHSGAYRIVAEPTAGAERVGQPTWSPDGKFLAYNDRGVINTRFREGYNQIRIVDIETATSTMYSPNEHGSLSDRGDCGPAWSPDGKWLAYISESSLWVLPVDNRGQATGEPRMLTKTAADSPSWTGDSRFVYYQYAGQLLRVPVDGGASNKVRMNLTWQPERPPQRVRIHAGQLWDGVTDTVQHDVDIIVENGRVAGLEPHRRGGRGERFVDASDQTVLPGLWESHNHPTEQPAMAGRYFAAYLAYGITGNVTMGSIAPEGALHRESLLTNDMLGPRHFFTGELFDGTRTSHPPTRAFATAEGLERSLDRAEAYGYDYMKTYVRTTFEAMRKVSDRGHSALGVPAGTHLLAQGVLAGQDMITHLSATQRLEFSYSQTMTGRVYDDVRAILTKGRFHVIVTPFQVAALYGLPELKSDPRVTELLPPWVAAEVLSAPVPTTAQLAAIDREVTVYADLVRRGAKVMAGSDSPLMIPGLALHLVLRGMARSELSAFEILRTATVVPAEVMGVGDDLGRIAEGKLADLTFVNGDPFTNFDSLMDTPRVMKGGRIIDRRDVIAPFTKARMGSHVAQSIDAAGAEHWTRVGQEIAAHACCRPR